MLMSRSSLVCVDFGKKRDFSAMCMLERLAREPGGRRQPGRIYPPTTPYTPATYICHHLYRWPLLTPYPTIVADVVRVLASGRVPRPVTLLCDGTGPGVAIVDLFDATPVRPQPIAVVVTTGYQTTQLRAREIHTPKKDLVLHVGAAGDDRPARLILGPRLPFFDAVKKELESFSAETNPVSGHITYEAYREQDHDDLVFALALGVWYGEVFGDSNWSTNVDISPAADGRLVRKRLVPGLTKRRYRDEFPHEAPFDQDAWDALQREDGAADSYNATSPETMSFDEAKHQLREGHIDPSSLPPPWL